MASVGQKLPEPNLVRPELWLSASHESPDHKLHKLLVQLFSELISHFSATYLTL